MKILFYVQFANKEHEQGFRESYRQYRSEHISKNPSMWQSIGVTGLEEMVSNHDAPNTSRELLI